MGSIEAWTRFFGWCTVLNLGMYLISVVAVLTMRGFILRRNARWFGIPEEEVLRTTFRWIATYKLALIMLALVPWLALKLMA
ncbi:MAG: hypothetical protein R3F05_12750 [Planctomycetota bacterium]|nr:hypothetical protein [Planctomycetota bacterium]MCB9824516.1 hypothetical protein [Planctomycetota bacterium]MCB9900512.1 hypothetical protein [Planctomycetota bacterium]